MGKLLYLIGGGVGLIAEASSRRSGRDNSGGGNGGRGSSQAQQQVQQPYGSYNNERDDAPPSYDQANRGLINRPYQEEEEEKEYDYGQKSNLKQLSFRDQDRGQSDEYYDSNASMQQNDSYAQQQLRNEECARWQRQNFPNNPILPPPPSSPNQFLPTSTSPFQDTPSNQPHLPILIPQRRSEKKSRGWTLAYPPSLQTHGISQDTFINFLLEFNEACQASPALDAVNLAAFGVGFAPGIAPMVISMVVPVAVKMTKTRMVDSQAAGFLERANREIFGLRGLVAMICTFSGKGGEVVRYDTNGSEGMNDRVGGGEFVMPQSEELIYLDDEAVGGWRGVGGFVGDYYDRRSQVQYAQNNPQYADPNRPEPQFANRFSNPANGGSLLGVLSGGAIQRPSRDDRKSDRRGRRDRRRGKSPSSSSDNDNGGRQKRVGLIGSLKGAMGAPPEAQGPGGLLSMAASKIGGGNGGQRQGVIRGFKSKVAQEDLLYLMLVEKPGSSGPRGVEESTDCVAELDGSQRSPYVAELDGSQMSPYVAELEGGMSQRSSGGGFRSETYGEDDNRRK